MKKIRIMSSLLIAVIIYNMIGISAFACSNQTGVFFSDDSNLKSVSEEAMQMYREGVSTREIYELYYHAGYISKEDIEFLLRVDEINNSKNIQYSVNGSDFGEGDIREINTTVSREEILLAKSAASIAAIFLARTKNPAGLTAALFLAVAVEIANYILSTSDFVSITVSGKLIHQYNPDTCTMTWFPYEGGLGYTVNR